MSQNLTQISQDYCDVDGKPLTNGFYIRNNQNDITTATVYYVSQKSQNDKYWQGESSTSTIKIYHNGISALVVNEKAAYFRKLSDHELDGIIINLEGKLNFIKTKQK